LLSELCYASNRVVLLCKVSPSVAYVCCPSRSDIVSKWLTGNTPPDSPNILV